VWLLSHDGPAMGIKAVLPFFNMESPVGIEIFTQVDGPELNDRFTISSAHRIPERSIPLSGLGRQVSRGTNLIQYVSIGEPPKRRSLID
jgi:hypothetical protein